MLTFFTNNLFNQWNEFYSFKYFRCYNFDDLSDQPIIQEDQAIMSFTLDQVNKIRIKQKRIHTQFFLLDWPIRAFEYRQPGRASMGHQSALSRSEVQRNHSGTITIHIDYWLTKQLPPSLPPSHSEGTNNMDFWKERRV